MIEPVHDEVNLVIGERIEASILVDVLSYEAIGVFV